MPAQSIFSAALKAFLIRRQQSAFRHIKKTEEGLPAFKKGQLIEGCIIREVKIYFLKRKAYRQKM